MAIGDQYRQIQPDDRWIEDVNGNIVGVQNPRAKFGSETRWLTADQTAAAQALVSGAWNAQGLGQHIIAPPVAAGSFTITQNGGGTPTVEAVTIDGEQCLRITASAADQYINLMHALPATVPVHSAILEGIWSPADQASVALYFGQSTAFNSATAISKALTVTGQSNQSYAAGVMAPLICTELPSGAPGALTTQWNNGGSLNLQSALFGYAQVRVTPQSGKTAQLTLRRITVNPSRKGRIAIVADDGKSSWMRRALPLLERRGLRCSMAVIPDKLGSSSAYVTAAELRDVVRRGHEVLTHGPIGGAGSLIDNYTTTADRLADAVACRQALRDLGVMSATADRCYIWPQGKWQSAQGDASLLDAMRAAGFTVGRSVSRYFPTSVADALATQYGGLMLPIIGHVRGADATAESAVINNMVSAIQACGASGLDGVLMFHDVIDAGGAYGDNDQIEVDRLITVLDAIVTQIAAGRVENVLFSQMHGGIGV